MTLHVGTSGFSYKEWKGSFYPKELPDKQMLRYYGERFGTVEINNTFYRMPSESVLENWAAEVPAAFSFVLKAPQRITHRERLKGSADSVAYFLKVAGVLGERLGPLLFQLPPNFKKDLPLLQEFLSLLPPKTTAAFEFRNASWLEDDVFDALRSRNIALCFADSETRETPIVATADYAYFRLRDEGYGDDDIAKWAKMAADLGAKVKDVFVYFKHEDEGKGAAFGQQMMRLLEQS